MTNAGSFSTTGGAILGGELTLSSATPVIRMTDTADVDSIRFDMIGAQAWRFVNEDLSSVPLSLSIATDVFTFGQIPAGPVADPTTDNQFARKKYVDDRATFFALSVKIDDPSTAALSSTTIAPIIRVPNMASAFLSRMHVIFNSGSHTAGASLSLVVVKNFVAVGTVTLNDTNNTINTFYATDFADSAIADGDSIGFVISARSGTITERDVSIIVEGFQKVKSV